MKSLSEIDTVSKRASRASGFEWGVAEEIGKNTRMLEMFGIQGVKNLNYYYKIIQCFLRYGLSKTHALLDCELRRFRAN